MLQLCESELATPAMMIFSVGKVVMDFECSVGCDMVVHRVLNGEQDVVMTVEDREETSRWTWTLRSLIKLLVAQVAVFRSQ